MAAEETGTGKTQKKQNTGRQRKIRIIFGIETAVLLVMVGILYVVMMGTEKVEDVRRININPEVLAIPEKVQEQKMEEGAMHGYLNIALFGVDATQEDQIYKGSRSDSTMIASVNLDTGDIKLVSIYRDTYLNLSNDRYEKCNGAYSYGGAEQAMKMLNMNLDMDITKFVTVGYKGLSEVIDGLGGVYVEVDAEELKHINNYQIAVAEVLQCDYTPVTQEGYQLLNGVQATAYCRIRQTVGWDFQRTSRQREVLQAIEDRAKEKTLEELTEAFENAAEDIYTNLDTKDILNLLRNINDYSIVEEGGFPEENVFTTATLGAKGDCVIPWNGGNNALEENVVWLHRFLFGDEDYAVSDTVKECSRQIYEDTSPYINRTK